MFGFTSILRGRLLLVAMVLLSFACSNSEAPDFQSPPIIIFDIDTLRADHLGCYGYDRDTSPNIDTFAESAAVFEWTFAQGPNTPPSQTSILTSLYPSSHGRVVNNDVVAEEAETLAEVLSSAGYRTAAFVDGGQMAAGFGLEQGFEIYDDDGGGIEKIWPKVSAWIDRGLQSSAKPPAPFLLLIHCYDVHSPYEITPWRFRDRFVPDLSEVPPVSFSGRMSEVMAKTWKARDEDPPPQLGPTKLEYAKAMYDGGIRHVDARFGEMVRTLKENRLFNQSIIVVISDHGDSFQEHGALFHEQIYSPVTRIPMIIRFPESRLSGRLDPVVESIDLMPTLLDYTAIAIPEMAQGRSLLPMLKGEEWTPKFAITESPYRGRRLGAASELFRLLLTKKPDESELFNYREDPLEQRDLTRTHHDQTRDLRLALEEWQEKVSATQWKKSKAGPLDSRTLKQLKVLGYID